MVLSLRIDHSYIVVQFKVIMIDHEEDYSPCETATAQPRSKSSRWHGYADGWPTFSKRGKSMNRQSQDS